MDDEAAVVFDRNGVSRVDDGGRPTLLDRSRPLDRVSGAEIFALIDAELRLAAGDRRVDRSRRECGRAGGAALEGW